MKAPERPSSKASKSNGATRSEMNVKIYFQQNWRHEVRVLQTDNTSDYRKFLKQLKTLLKIRDNKQVIVKYQDVSGDYIVITCDSEMRLATKNIRHGEVFKISLQLAEEVTLPTLCDKCDHTITCSIRYKCDKCEHFVCCVPCYQSARVKTNIHEHELYKEKFPCYCPMHRVGDGPAMGSEMEIRGAQSRPSSAASFLMRGHMADKGRSSSMPEQYHSRGSSSMDMTEDMFRGIDPSAPPYHEDRQDVRTSERSEMLRGPQGDTYNRHQMQVIESPNSGVVAIRARRSRETRSRSNQLG